LARSDGVVFNKVRVASDPCGAKPAELLKGLTTDLGFCGVQNFCPKTIYFDTCLSRAAARSGEVKTAKVSRTGDFKRGRIPLSNRTDSV
jgi:hypothetical protein